ncbi:Transposase [Enterobacter roggenkampii]
MKKRIAVAIVSTLLVILSLYAVGNDSNLLIVFYVQIMPDDFVMQLHRF